MTERAIRHSFRFFASPQAIFDALTDGRRIARWWTVDCAVAHGIGAVSTFEWKSHGWSVEVKTIRLEQDRLVEWRCVRSNMQDTDAWVGTRILFEISPAGNGESRLAFSQTGYRESSCREVCSAGWRFVLGTSLKEYLETGTGKPYRPQPLGSAPGD